MCFCVRARAGLLGLVVCVCGGVLVGCGVLCNFCCCVSCVIRLALRAAVVWWRGVSVQERMVDALASGADEGRGNLR